MIRILIVDDDKTLVKAYEILLECRYGAVHTVHAHNGKEALEKARKHDYSVILSDIDMPVMNGIEFYKELKKEKPLLAKRVGFISGCLHESISSFITREKCSYLAKPFRRQDFYKLVDCFL